LPILTRIDAFRKKLESLKKEHLVELCDRLGIDSKGSRADLIIGLLEADILEQEAQIDNFIKQKYQELVTQRQETVSNETLRAELQRVETFDWGVIQGDLDQKIQRGFVRRFYRFQELVQAVERNLYPEILNYAICSWYNYWSTILLEEQIALHPRIVPTLKNIKGVDIFFDGQPFDLKITYLPQGYNPQEAVLNPRELARYLYEHQGRERFGADNRLFIVLFDMHQPEESWKLKREFDFVLPKIEEFLQREQVSEEDEIIFTYRNQTYSALAKILLIYRD